MKKFFILLTAIVTMTAAVVGCSDDKKKSKSDNASESSSAVEELTTVTATEPLTDPLEDGVIRDIQPAEGTYVYDNAGILSPTDLAECNDYAEWLYEKFLINAAVVTSDNLGELSPAEFAENAYMDIYGGRGSGLLLLINNDTNEDYLYKQGSCHAIPEDKQTEAFYWATQELVTGDYKAAILRLMKLGEYCSQYVFDVTGVFIPELADDLEEKCRASKKNLTVLATSNGTGASDEEICKSYYERRYNGESGVMIMIDSATPNITVYSESALPKNIDEIIATADDVMISDDYHSAVLHIIHELEAE